MKLGKCVNSKHYVRVGVFKIEEVLPFVFDKSKRKTLKEDNISYYSQLWKNLSKREFDTFVGKIKIPMGSHRYELFALKGTKCVSCGIEGEYFALERGHKNSPTKFHFNLYGVNAQGNEVMLTKDHIIPRSKGGINAITNYQPMCIRCNGKKADNYD